MASNPPPNAKSIQGGAPLYATIARSLRDEISAGRWSPGDLLPTIDTLMHDYGVGRATVRIALKMLADEGLIISERGRGTFVLGRPRDDIIVHDLLAPPAGLRVEVLEQDDCAELPAGQILLETVPDAPRTGFKHAKKLHKHAGEPVSIVELWYDPSLLPPDIKADALSRATVFQLMYPALADRDVRVRQTLRVGAANLGVAKHLGCELGAPLVRMQRLIYAPDRSSVFYFGDFDYDAAKYVMDIDGQFRNLKALATGTGLSVSDS